MLCETHEPVPLRDCLPGTQSTYWVVGQIAQLAEEASEAVHLLDGLPREEQVARLNLVVGSLAKVIRKAEGYTGRGHGGRALEALVAIAEEVVRPTELLSELPSPFNLLPPFTPLSPCLSPAEWW